jgi:hypothetical protein
MLYDRIPANLSMAQLEVALAGLRRIRSLESKNVPKYAQQIAKETLDQIEKLLPFSDARGD